MKRPACVALVLLIASACSWALPVGGGFRLGATIGTAFGSDWDLIKSNMESLYASYGIPVSVKDGLGLAFTGGLFVEIPSTGRVALQLELLYDQYSAPMRIENDWDSSDWVRWIERYRVLEAPLLVKLRVTPGFALFGGAIGAWRFGDLVEIMDYSGETDTDKDTVEATGYADYLYGVVGGIEIRNDFGEDGEEGFIVFDIRYVRMLAPVTDLDPPADNKLYVQGLTISMGAALPVRRRGPK